MSNSKAYFASLVTGITFFLLFFVVVCNAQTLTFTEASKASVAQQNHNASGGTLDIGTLSFEIYLSKSGTRYILQPNSTDPTRMSKIYIGSDIGQKFNNQYPIVKMNSGTYYYIMQHPTRTGCITKKKLIVNK